MKRELMLLISVLFSAGMHAQLQLPVYFEEPEEDTNWVQFSNGGNAAENFVLAENPDKTGINPSNTCIQLTVVSNADPWAGAYSDGYGEIAITDENYMLQMMVYKDVITDCDLKLELGGDTYEVKVANTETGVWEQLSFDFTAVIGKTYTRLTLFPDFPATRTEGSLCYIDNVGFEGTFDFGTSWKDNNLIKFSLSPNPVEKYLTIRSEGIKNITITNLVGQNVKLIRCRNTDYEVLDLSDFTKGVYFLTLETTNGTAGSKFIKK
jgi:hypothetical protein